MKAKRKALLACVALGTIAPGLKAVAQMPPMVPKPPHMGRPGQPYMQLFDARTVETVEGELKSIDRATHRHMGMMGVHATVKTSGGDLTVHLGPAWFIDNQELKLKVGDKVTVTGSRVKFEGADIVIATEVKRGADTLKLREADGTPVWVAWRKAS